MRNPRLGLICVATLTLALTPLANAVPVAMTFDTLDQRSTLVGQTGVEPLVFSILNNTTEVWTDFHVSSRLALDVDSYVGPGTPVFGTTNTLSDILGGHTVSGTLDIFNLAVDIGQTLSFTVNGVCPAILESCQAAAQFGQQIDLFPTIDGDVPDDPIASVPEPSTLIALGLGILGLAWTRKRRING